MAKKVMIVKGRRAAVDVIARHEVVVGATLKHFDTLYTVEAVSVNEDGSLRVDARVIGRPLCAETLVRGETYPLRHLRV